MTTIEAKTVLAEHFSGRNYPDGLIVEACYQFLENGVNVDKFLQESESLVSDSTRRIRKKRQADLESAKLGWIKKAKKQHKVKKQHKKTYDDMEMIESY